MTAPKLTEPQRRVLQQIAAGNWNAPPTMHARVWTRLLWRLHRERYWRQEWADDVVVGRYLTALGRSALKGDSQ